MILEKIKEAYKHGAIEAKVCKRLEEYFDLEETIESEELSRRIDDYIDKHTNILIKNQKMSRLERIFYEIGYLIEFNTVNLTPLFYRKR